MTRVLQILLQRHCLPATLFFHQIPGIGVQFALEPAKVQEEGSRVVISVDDEPESLWKKRLEEGVIEDLLEGVVLRCLRNKACSH